MIKLSQEVPEVFDATNPDALKNWMIAIKQCIDELARKAQSLQMEVRTSVPTSSDLEEGEFVRVNTNIYTKINGVIVAV